MALRPARAAWLTVVAVLIFAAVFGSAGVASATAQAPAKRLLGVIPIHDGAAGTAAAPTGDLLYHGGPGMHSPTIYTVYWEPRGHRTGTTYKDVIDGFLSNVAAASGRTDNVFGALSQFADTTGPIGYNIHFGGRIVDGNPYPASGCLPGHGPVCLDDSQLETELAKVLIGSGLPTGVGAMYVILTPRDVTTCQIGNTCSDSGPCAYHNWLNGSSPTPYAVQPFPHKGCDADGKRPNGTIADEAVSYISHEVMEAITDPVDTGWWFGPGPGQNEIGDECLHVFGPTLGGAGNAIFNQIINGGHYDVQDEWSNRDGGCVARASSGGYSPPIARFAYSPASPAARSPTTFDASSSSDSGVNIVSYRWDFGDGQTGNGIGVTHTYSASGSYIVTLLVTDADYLIGATSQTITVGSAAGQATSIGAGQFHTCAVLAGGSVGCWGRNDFGELGNGTTTCSSCANSSPGPVSQLANAVRIAGGVGHTCALLSDQTVSCWGMNEYGQLGNGSNQDTFVPAAVRSLSDATALAVGAFHSCALTQTGSVACWGQNQYGQLGDGTTTDSHAESVRLTV